MDSHELANLLLGFPNLPVATHALKQTYISGKYEDFYGPLKIGVLKVNEDDEYIIIGDILKTNIRDSRWYVSEMLHGKIPEKGFDDSLPMGIEAICVLCKERFFLKRNVVRAGLGRYCSKKCRDDSLRKGVMETCPICHVSFMSRPSSGVRYKRRYCSKKCACQGNALNPLDILEKYTKKAGEDECWLWINLKLTSNGYGRFKAAGKYWSAHRLAYVVAKGQIPKDLLIRHTCDNSLCVNPKHLIPGTPQQNTDDRMRKMQNLKNQPVSMSTPTREEL